MPTVERVLLCRALEYWPPEGATFVGGYQLRQELRRQLMLVVRWATRKGEAEEFPPLGMTLEQDIATILLAFWRRLLHYNFLAEAFQATQVTQVTKLVIAAIGPNPTRPELFRQVADAMVEVAVPW